MTPYKAIHHPPKNFGKNGIKTWEMETKDHSSLSAFTNTNNYISSGKYADDVDDTVADYQAQFGVGLRV